MSMNPCPHHWTPTLDALNVATHIGSASYSLSLRCSDCGVVSDEPQAFTIGSVRLERETSIRLAYAR